MTDEQRTPGQISHEAQEAYCAEVFPDWLGKDWNAIDKYWKGAEEAGAAAVAAPLLARIAKLEARLEDRLMTDEQRTPGQIVRAEAEDDDLQYGCDWGDLPENAKARWEAAASAVRVPLLARIEQLEERLEIDHLYKMDPANEHGFVRVEVPSGERDDQIDAVSARDATIALLEDRVRELKKGNDWKEERYQKLLAESERMEWRLLKRPT